jgi:hypothetical protein
MQKGAGIETGRPVDAGDAHSSVRASSDHAVETSPQGSSRSVANDVRRARGSEIPLFDPDVLRIIEPKAGPHIEVRNGERTGREYQILELQDGRFVWRYTDNGERVAASAGCTRTLIDDLIHAGVFVEVRRA